MAQAQAESEHRLYERAERGRKAAQKRILEVEAVIRDARRIIFTVEAEEMSPKMAEVKKVLGRAGAVSNGYRDAGRSKLDGVQEARVQG